MTTKRPQLDPIDVDSLEDGAPEDLLAGALLESVRFTSLAVDEADLKGARLSEVVLDRVDLPVVRAARSRWRDVRVTGRIGSLEAYESEQRSVHFVGCKLSFVNLRGAELLDVAFTDCVIEELDLVQCKARRVRIAGTRIAHLDVQHSELRDVDLRGAELESIAGLSHLRGATVTSSQLTLLAPLLAAELGIEVED